MAISQIFPYYCWFMLVQVAWQYYQIPKWTLNGSYYYSSETIVDLYPNGIPRWFPLLLTFPIVLIMISQWEYPKYFYIPNINNIYIYILHPKISLYPNYYYIIISLKFPILLLVHVIIFHNIWDNPTHWLSYFSRWLLHHQPVIISQLLLYYYIPNVIILLYAKCYYILYPLNISSI